MGAGQVRSTCVPAMCPKSQATISTHPNEPIYECIAHAGLALRRRNDKFGGGSFDLIGEINVRVTNELTVAMNSHMPIPLIATVTQMQQYVL